MCELCKTAFPYQVKVPGKDYYRNVIEYDIPELDSDDDELYYIVLESISSNTSKVIHVVDMRCHVKMYIGRGHDAQIRVTDISVSRMHAVFIKSVSGHFYLADNESKFGTLALVKHPTKLNPKYTNHL